MKTKELKSIDGDTIIKIELLDRLRKIERDFMLQEDLKEEVITLKTKIKTLLSNNEYLQDRLSDAKLVIKTRNEYFDNVIENNYKHQLIQKENNELKIKNLELETNNNVLKSKVKSRCSFF